MAQSMFGTTAVDEGRAQRSTRGLSMRQSRKEDQQNRTSRTPSKMRRTGRT
jgi:hypothetical protein